MRGGSWNNNARRARSAYRNANHPGNANNNLGFRVCLSSMSAGARMSAAAMDQTRVLTGTAAVPANRKVPEVLVDVSAARCDRRLLGWPLHCVHDLDCRCPRRSRTRSIPTSVRDCVG